MPLAAVKEYLFQEAWPPPLHDPDIRDPVMPKVFYWMDIFQYLQSQR